MPNYTRFTNLEVTGELKANDVTLDLSTITRPADKAGDHFSDAEIKAIVDAVNGILTALGKPAS